MTNIDLIFTEEEKKKITVRFNGCGLKVITVDLHEYSVNCARRFLKNLIGANRGEFVLEVIHGWTHGSKLLEMVRTETLSERLTYMVPSTTNRGVTYLAFS